MLFGSPEDVREVEQEWLLSLPHDDWQRVEQDLRRYRANRGEGPSSGIDQIERMMTDGATPEDIEAAIAEMRRGRANG